MRLLIITCFCSLHLCLAGQTTLEARLDSLVNHEVAAADFSGVVLVARGGETLLHRAVGMAYYQKDVPITPSTHFSIASVTKLFTAVAILQLREEGKLALTDKLEQHLPELNVPGAADISLADLLLHNSGLPSEKSGIYRSRITSTAFVAKTLKNRSKVRRGEYNYNNLDYVLLGLVIEKLRGAPWREVVRTRILQPAKLENTGFLEYGYYPKNFAYTYQATPFGQLRQDPFFYIENFYAAASMYSNAEDLLRFHEALNNDVLLSATSREILAREFPGNNYAGYSVWNYRYPYVKDQPKVMERRGGILGANVVLVRFPEDDACIIILSNTDRFDPDSFGDPTNFREALMRELYRTPTLTNR